MRIVLVVMFLSFFAAGDAFAQEGEGGPVSTDPAAAQLTNELSQEIYSPFCPGKTLAMCPSPNAAEVRRDIQRMAESGMSEEEIKDSVISQYGEEFRIAEPGVADDIPILAAIIFGLILAILAVIVISRRRSEEEVPTESTEEEPVPSSTPPPGDTEPDDPYLDELRSQYRD